MTHISWELFYICDKCGKKAFDIKVVGISRSRHRCRCGNVWYCGN